MMKIKLLAAIATITTLSTFAPLGAVAAPKEGRAFELPAQAVKIHENIFSLGFAIDPLTSETVEGYAIIHRKNGKAAPGGKGGKPTSSTCYSFLADGAKWKEVEPWIINTANTRGLSGMTLHEIMSSSIDKWETAAGVNIFSTGTITTETLSAETTAPDGKNEVYFGSITEANVIAVTTVWGVFNGPTKNRKLVEWDMVFDQTDFDWSLTGQPGKMDFENIATHELGHALGMGHPASSCTEETMYAYAENGETKKRDLAAGDIAGISSLY